jgi:C-terminal processing protease CtpA/Prc
MQVTKNLLTFCRRVCQVGIGDALVSVDDSIVTDLPHAEIVRLVRGPPDTKVTLGLCRATQDLGTPGQNYVVLVQRSTTRPVLQHAFGSRKRGFQSSHRTYLVM